MPIALDFDVRPMSEDAFKEVAYAVTGAAFAMHNQLGRLFSEHVYKHELAARCRSLGLPDVRTEAAIHVTHRDYATEYFVDLLVGGGAVFELKAVSGLNEHHRAQALNYLFLSELSRAKLFNFGATSVEHEFVSTTLTLAERRRLAIDDRCWKPASQESSLFFDPMIGLLSDWGAFLSLVVYCDALTHFFGGEETVIRDVPVTGRSPEPIMQRMHLLNATTAFRLTGFREDLPTAEDHLRRLLNHTPLRALEWVNLHHHEVTFTTLLNER